MTEAGELMKGQAGVSPDAEMRRLPRLPEVHHHCPQLMRDDIQYESIGTRGNAIRILDRNRIINFLYDST